jgi:predicted ATPase
MHLVERGTQLAALGEHLAVAAAGHGRLVLVAGEAGIGKTALVRQFVDEHEAGARVLWGACDGLFTPQPLRPLLDVADELGLEADAPQRQLFSATLDALRPGPTIVVFEDVHWADGATVDLLRFLGRRLDRVPRTRPGSTTVRTRSSLLSTTEGPRMRRWAFGPAASIAA